MLKKTARKEERQARVRRIRAKISGVETRPRLVVFRSLKNISVQAIDDTKGMTVASADLRGMKSATNTVSGAFELGKHIGEKCLALGLKTVVFDRAGYRYHGKVKAVADGAREAGLLF